MEGRSKRAYHILSEETRTELAETGLLPDYTVALLYNKDFMLLAISATKIFYILCVKQLHKFRMFHDS